MAAETILEEIRDYIRTSLLKNESLNIDNGTRLISGGIIDSISTLQLVDFLEKKYKIEFQPHEVDRDNLDTLELIVEFVSSKL